MDIVRAPDPWLRVKTKPVKKITPGLLQTLKQMIRLTKSFKDPEGVGLASTQVGSNGSFFVAKADTSEVEKSNKFAAFFNPQILSFSKKTKIHFEGCLSTPNWWGGVVRSTSVKVSYQDETGTLVKKNLTGLLAHIFQHEVDHLNGVLFQDRVLQQKGKFYKFKGKDGKTGEDIFQEVTI